MTKVQMIRDVHFMDCIYKRGEVYEASKAPGNSFHYMVKHSGSKVNSIGINYLFRVNPKLEDNLREPIKDTISVIEMLNTVPYSEILKVGYRYPAVIDDDGLSARIHSLGESEIHVCSDDYIVRELAGSYTKLEANGPDCFGYIAQETSLDRESVKCFIYEHIRGGMITEVAREFKLPIHSIAHIFLCWDQWIGLAE